MAQFSDDLYSLTGRVASIRPNLSEITIQQFINDRIRQVLDSRTYWSDLLSHGVLSVPNFYKTGTVNMTVNSPLVTGTGTAWPINDVVNTTVAAGIADIGYVEVTPVSMIGIAVDTYLYVDAAGTPETVAVIEVTPSTFIAKFAGTHAAGCTLTSSSLTGMQFRLGNGTPIFTVASVQDATDLTLDMPWGNASVTNQAYQIVKAYFTLAPDLKEVLFVLDQIQGIPLRIHVSSIEINWRDPQRSSTGPPLALVDLAPSAGGSMQHELWPWQFGSYQLGFIYMRQWPELKRDTDRPPWFINPTILYHGAVADALRVKINDKDVYHNPQMAMDYEQRFLGGLEMAKNADESKAERDYQFQYDQLFGAAGANFWQSHDPDVMSWNF